MLYQFFREQWKDQACFSTQQVYAWRPRFDKNNLGRWVKQGLLVKLRNAYYTFPEFLQEPGFHHYVAGIIYKPSYVSLHTALSVYGLIPEAIASTTSITTRKTATFDNELGWFSYKSVKPELYFGFDIRQQAGPRYFRLAQAEKALLDLLYIYPFYNTVNELEELRLNEQIMHEIIQKDLLLGHAETMASKALMNRVNLLIKTYGL